MKNNRLIEPVRLTAPVRPRPSFSLKICRNGWSSRVFRCFPRAIRLWPCSSRLMLTGEEAAFVYVGGALPARGGASRFRSCSGINRRGAFTSPAIARSAPPTAFFRST